MDTETKTKDFEVYIGSYGTIRIMGNDELDRRLLALRERVQGNAPSKPVGKRIYESLKAWERSVEAAIRAQHGEGRSTYWRGDDGGRYALTGVSMAAFEEAEGINAAGKAAARARGAIATCRMAGCTQPAVKHGLCAACAHDEE